MGVSKDDVKVCAGCVQGVCKDVYEGEWERRVSDYSITLGIY